MVMGDDQREYAEYELARSRQAYHHNRRSAHDPAQTRRAMTTTYVRYEVCYIL